MLLDTNMKSWIENIKKKHAGDMIPMRLLNGKFIELPVGMDFKELRSPKKKENCMDFMSRYVPVSAHKLI